MSAERIYSVVFKAVTVAAAQDLFMIKASATNGLALRRASISASGVTSAAEITLLLKRLPATVTNGSGGSAPTIRRVSDRNAATALSSARANDTSGATSGGTIEELAAWNWNVLQEFLEVPPTDGERWECDQSEALALCVTGSPASTVLSGTFVFQEV